VTARANMRVGLHKEHHTSPRSPTAGTCSATVATALERMLDRLRPLLHDSTRMATDDTAAKPISLYDRDKRRGTKDQVRQQTSRAQRYAGYAQV
jgi:hypothetical protein